MPLAPIISIPADSDPLMDDESNTVYLESSGNLMASREVHCTIALEFQREIIIFHCPHPSPMIRAQRRPFSRKRVILPFFSVWREMRVFASRRMIDLSEKISATRDSEFV